VKKFLFPVLFSALLCGGPVLAQNLDTLVLPRTPSPAGAKTYIQWPKDGKTVKPKFKVMFGLKGMGVAPAGIKQENTGHHHLLINVPEDKMPSMALPLPATDNIKHFGGGQTEVMLELPEGEHTLQLVFGDFLHIPHDPPVVSKRVKITVKASEK